MGLVIAPTPIGNLGDVSDRLRAALAAADVVACEDTRRTSSLLRHLGIARPRLVVLNDHTERDVVAALMAELDADRHVVLVSDAGTPVVSDPGFRLVRAALDAGHEPDVLPGPNAAVTALVASGLAAERFCFEGFLPRKGAERMARLGELAVERRTSILYEAPHRVARTLEDLRAACGGDRAVAVARELTKLHQEVWRGDLDGAVAWAEGAPRGEMVVVVGGAPEPVDADDEDLRAALAAELAAGATRRDAVAAVAARLGAPRRRVYDLAVRDLP